MNVVNEIRIALESHLDALVIATTGAQTNIAASGYAYTRTTGSFIVDDFQVGDHVLASGFAPAAANGFSRVTAVAALGLTVDRSVGPAAAGPSVLVKAVLPQQRLWQGQPERVGDFSRPVVRASLAPAGMVIVGVNGDVPLYRHFGAFLIDLFHPVEAGRGRSRAERLAGAIRARFKPATTEVDSPSGVRVVIDGLNPGSILETEADILQLPIAPGWRADSLGV